MYYTVRFAHLKNRPDFRAGEEIHHGEFLGTAGNTGASDGIHLHIDCVEGIISRVWKLSETEHNCPQSCPKQLNHFIDSNLFKSDIAVTTPYCDHEYMKSYGKVHHAYDVVPKDRKSWGIHWNRSKVGSVLLAGPDPDYGNVLLVGFQA